MSLLHISIISLGQVVIIISGMELGIMFERNIASNKKLILLILSLITGMCMILLPVIFI